ncbi:uncharacterized protein [Montipora foliosa]|uniref:uncharacterized protein n=1 Tax=Montipora foliosa TaxID=591990 RepID=UPI0035F18168
MVRRLAANPEKLHLYNDIIQEQKSRDFIEKLKDPDTTNEVCHYIPHHAVHKDSNTTPLHIVYDCSFKQGDQPSLNDCLQPGSPLLNDLTDDPGSEFIVYRFKSVMFGATKSPFILNATLNKHLAESTDQVSMDMLRNLNVDDLASGVSDEGSAVNYYQDARNTMSPVGFNLRSWSSNSPGLQHLAAKDQVLDNSPAKKYDSQLSMTLGTLVTKVQRLKLPCCQGQLPSFPRVTFRALTSRASDEPAKIYKW